MKQTYFVEIDLLNAQFAANQKLTNQMLLKYVIDLFELLMIVEIWLRN